MASSGYPPRRFLVGAVPQVDGHAFRDLYEEYPDF